MQGQEHYVKNKVRERYGKIALTGNSDCCCLPQECCNDGRSHDDDSNSSSHSVIESAKVIGYETKDIYSIPISGASMNPARSLAPALVSGNITDLWLYWSATFIGTTIIAFALRKKLIAKMKHERNIEI
jgi:hypothetical protein